MSIGRSFCTFVALAAALTAALATGCGERPEIRTYRTPRRDRMIVAMTEHDSTLWFFRLAGQREWVDEQAEAFNKFVESLTFNGAGQGGPSWTLPAGWKELPPNAEENRNPAFPRFATIQIEFAAHEPLEISVTRLPLPTLQPLDLAVVGVNRWLGVAAQSGLLQARTEFLLANVNRWLGQLRRSPAEVNELSQYVRPVATPYRGVSLFDATGFLKATPPAPAAPPRQPDADPSTPQDPQPPAFALGKPPADWKPARRDQFSVESYAIERSGLSAAYTVSPFPASGPIADRLANVNRWRGLIGLPDWTREELNTSARVFAVDGIDGILVNLVSSAAAGDSQTTLGVIVEAEGQIWFFKLTGDTELVARERKNFESLVAATKFSPSNE